MIEVTTPIEIHNQAIIKRSIYSENKSKPTPDFQRRFINKAIFIETPILKPTSTFLISRMPNEVALDPSQLQIKRCTCGTNPQKCPFHSAIIPQPQNIESNILKISEEKSIKCTKKSISPKSIQSTIKTSFSSLASSNSTERDLVLQNWLSRKKDEKCKQLEKERNKMKIMEKEKAVKAEREKKNFEQWLATKKQKEAEIKKRKQKELEEKELKELEKDKRQLENQLSYELWRKKKEEEILERKIKEQLDIIADLEKKKQKIVDNEKAFNEWMQNSKNKPKPVRSNCGLKSLCSSQNLSYINPNPWNPPI